MKMNFESGPSADDFNMDQGERVLNGILAEYYEKSMELEERLRHAQSEEERQALRNELDSVRASMKEADTVVSEGIDFPKNDSIHEIPDDIQDAA